MRRTNENSNPKQKTSLGFSKSWLQTAERNGSINLATSAAATETSQAASSPQTRRTVTPRYTAKLKADLKECSSQKEVTIEILHELVSAPNRPTIDATTGAIVEGDVGNPATKYFAKYTYTCNALDINVTNRLSIDPASVQKFIDEDKDNDVIADIEKEIVAAIDEVEINKERETKVANCKIKMDGDEEIDLENPDNSEDRIKCISRALQNSKLDREKREEFREELRTALNQKAENIRDALEEASQIDNPRERRKAQREALAQVKEVEGMFEGDTKKYFRSDIRLLKEGARDLVKTVDKFYAIQSLENNYSNNPWVRQWQTWRVEQLKREIDQLGGKYNVRDNPYYIARGKNGDYSPLQQARLNWADGIFNVAVAGITGQELNFDSEANIGGNRNGDNNFGVASNDARTRVQNSGLTYIPQFEQVNFNNNNAPGFQQNNNGQRIYNQLLPGQQAGQQFNQGVYQPGQTYQPFYQQPQQFQQTQQFPQQQQPQFNGRNGIPRV